MGTLCTGECGDGNCLKNRYASMLYLSLITNLAIVALEGWTLGHLRRKRDLFKYYTYLQNLIALLISAVFCICGTAALFQNRSMPQALRGLRYVASCGLTAAMLIYSAFLSSSSQNQLTEADFRPGITPGTANLMLHSLCPLLSMVSFLVFERPIAVTDARWTACAAIPSCGYWIVYLVLSAFHLWEDPYDFSAPKDDGKRHLPEALVMALLPVSFISISMVLWAAR